MTEIRKYVVVDADDQESDTEYDSLQDAIRDATLAGLSRAVIARIYTYEDSELVWTSTGGDVWPPSAGGRMAVNPPLDDDTKWWVAGDLRITNSLDETNHDYAQPVLQAARAEGLAIEADPEVSGSYFYCDDEATARKVVEIIDRIVPALWAKLV